MAFNYNAFFTATSRIRGGKYVWVKDAGDTGRRNVPFGSTVANPYKGMGYVWAGDLYEYRVSEPGYLFRSFKVAKATEASTDTTIYLNGDGYSCIPEVGNQLMVGPDVATTIGNIGKVTAVDFVSADNQFAVTIDHAIGSLAVGDILVEGVYLTSANADVTLLAVTATAPTTAAIGDKYFNTTSKKVFTATAENTWGETGADAVADTYYYSVADKLMYLLSGDTLVAIYKGTVLVKNPNTFVEIDTQFMPSDPMYGIEDVTFQINTIYGRTAWLERMQPLPKYVLAKNRSYIDGFFEI